MSVQRWIQQVGILQRPMERLKVSHIAVIYIVLSLTYSIKASVYILQGFV